LSSKEVSTVQSVGDISTSLCAFASGCALTTATPVSQSKLKVNSISTHSGCFCLVAGAALPLGLPCTCSGTIQPSTTKLKVSGNNLNRANDQLTLTPTGTGTGATVTIKDNLNGHKLMSV